jgi:hypothetical protein
VHLLVIIISESSECTVQQQRSYGLISGCLRQVAENCALPATRVLIDGLLVNVLGTANESCSCYFAATEPY